MALSGLDPNDLAKSFPWIQRQAAIVAERFPTLAGHADDLASEFAERWLRAGRPPIFQWVAVDVHRWIFSRGNDGIGVFFRAIDENEFSYTMDLDARLEVCRLKARLRPRHGHVLERYYEAGETLAEIGATTGVSGERIHQVRDEALAAARRVLEVQQP